MHDFKDEVMKSFGGSEKPEALQQVRASFDRDPYIYYVPEGILIRVEFTQSTCNGRLGQAWRERELPTKSR